MITEQENLIYGDSSDILNTIVSALIVNFHQELKTFNVLSSSNEISEGS